MSDFKLLASPQDSQIVLNKVTVFTAYSHQGCHFFFELVSQHKPVLQVSR